jgi:hypothetical protein
MELEGSKSRRQLSHLSTSGYLIQTTRLESQHSKCVGCNRSAKPAAFQVGNGSKWEDKVKKMSYATVAKNFRSRIPNIINSSAKSLSHSSEPVQTLLTCIHSCSSFPEINNTPSSFGRLLCTLMWRRESGTGLQILSIHLQKNTGP